MEADKVIERVLFSEEEISRAVKAMGRRLAEDYAGKTPLLVCVLKGASVFMSDLIRAIPLYCEIDFIQARSYGANTFSSGKVEFVKDLSTDIAGRDVIIVEDVLDSARTLKSVVHMLSERNPASIKVCVALDKPAAHQVEFEADYKCFDVGNEFVVGYGLDYAEKYRSFPYIGVLKKEIYS